MQVLANTLLCKLYKLIGIVITSSIDYIFMPRHPVSSFFHTEITRSCVQYRAFNAHTPAWACLFLLWVRLSSVAIYKERSGAIFHQTNFCWRYLLSTHLSINCQFQSQTSPFSVYLRRLTTLLRDEFESVSMCSIDHRSWRGCPETCTRSRYT